MSQFVRLTTSDATTLAADYDPAPGRRGIVLVHMMPADRTSWKSFASKLILARYSVLVIDLRGHGQSQGGPDGYRSFSDEEHQASRCDLEAGVAFLRSEGKDRVFLAGASIGANLALRYAAHNPDISVVILLSPGLDYRGVTIDGLVAGLNPEQGVYALASSEDRYAAESVTKLFSGVELGARRAMAVISGAEHGTDMFISHPEYMDTLIAWLGRH